MATASVTNPSLPDTPPDKTKVNTNFTDLVNFCNTNVIQADGSLAFTAIPTVTGAPDPVSDGSAVCKKYVDASKRQMVESRVVTVVDFDSPALGGDGLGTISAWGDSGLVAVPSWALSAVVSVTFQVVGLGGDVGGGTGSSWQMWLDIHNDLSTPFVFLGHFNDGTWGNNDISRHAIRQTLRWTPDSAVKGTTTSVQLNVQGLSVNGQLFSGSEGYAIFDFKFWGSF